MFEVQPARIRWEPNAFLMEVASGLKPGDALDIGMGNGRNALYLARAGWNVTGFDTASVGVAKARAAATEAKVALNRQGLIEMLQRLFGLAQQVVDVGQIRVTERFAPNVIGRALNL